MTERAYGFRGTAPTAIVYAVPEFIGGSGLAAVSGDGETRMSMKSAVLRVVVILGCLTGAAVGTMAQQATAHGTTTVVQMSYYALPGKEQEVLSIRLSACDVLEKTASPAVAC